MGSHLLMFLLINDFSEFTDLTEILLRLLSYIWNTKFRVTYGY